MSKNVIVIGAGLGGLSGAISLRQEGYNVTIHEKNAQIGGKLNVLKETRLHVRPRPVHPDVAAHLRAALFERSGKKMSDYIPIRTLRPHWRNFFEDGKVVDLDPDPVVMAAEARKVGEDPANVQRFLDYSARLYDLCDAGYFQQGLDTSAEFRAFYGLSKFPQFDLLRSMHGGTKRFLKTQKMQDIFDYFTAWRASRDSAEWCRVSPASCSACRCSCCGATGWAAWAILSCSSPPPGSRRLSFREP